MAVDYQVKTAVELLHYYWIVSHYPIWRCCVPSFYYFCSTDFSASSSFFTLPLSEASSSVLFSSMLLHACSAQLPSCINFTLPTSQFLAQCFRILWVDWHYILTLWYCTIHLTFDVVIKWKLFFVSHLKFVPLSLLSFLNWTTGSNITSGPCFPVILIDSSSELVFLTASAYQGNLIICPTFCSTSQFTV